jgi:hypothetical protein
MGKVAPDQFADKAFTFTAEILSFQFGQHGPNADLTEVQMG